MTRSVVTALPPAEVDGFLGAIELFSDLTPAEREAVAARLKLVSYKAGQALFEENQPRESLFLIYQGAVRLYKKSPLGEEKELAYVKNIIDKTAKEVLAENNVDIPYMVGTMIEIPRAALTAEEIARQAEFFSFGTNDLSQMTFGFSRDDAGKFLDAYYEKKIYEFDPFVRLDVVGVGKLVKMAVKLGRSTRPGMKMGICGEHGGDPSSVEFCHQAGLDYVSCSPFRVPIARLAAAQACIRYGNEPQE